jgi:hypothetical protein
MNKTKMKETTRKSLTLSRETLAELYEPKGRDVTGHFCGTDGTGITCCP